MTLHEKHLIDLKSSGLSDDMIEKMGIVSRDGLYLANAIEGIGNPQGAYSATAYEIPYFDLDGNRLSSRFKVFWTKPEDNDGKKKAKYLTQSGANWHAYIPPGFKELLNSEDYVIITEGEKKAAKAVQEGIPCIAIPGVTMWMDPVQHKKDKAQGMGMSFKSKPLNTIYSLAAMGKKILVVFDSDADIQKNEDVFYARQTLKDSLLYHCAEWSRTMDIPYPDDVSRDTKLGIDDLLILENGLDTLKNKINIELALSSMSMSPLMIFPYKEASNGKPLYYLIPNTPKYAKYNIHQILKQVEEFDNDGNPIISNKIIASTRVWLNRVVRSADGDGKTLYEIGYVPLDDRNPRYMTGGSELIRLSKQGDDQLADHGARVLNKERPALEEFLNDCQTYGVRAKKVSIVNGTKRRGWVEKIGDFQSPVYVMANKVVTEEQSISIESKDIPLLPIDTPTDMALKESLCVAGDKEVWKARIVKYILPSTIPALFMAASVSGLFRRWCPDSENFIIHLYGESSHGKTTTLRAAASIWGNPEKLMDSWRSTDNGLERRCASRNDMALFLDEAGMSTSEDVIKNSVYMIGNGGEKLRATRDASDRVTRRFQLVALSTGEKQLIRDSKFAGQEVRALEIHANAIGGSLWPTVKDGAEAEALNVDLNKNYGWGVEPLIKTIIVLTKSDPLFIHKLHVQMTQQLRNTLSKDVPPHIQRRVKHFGLMLTAWSLFLQYALELGDDLIQSHLNKLASDIANNLLQLETDQYKGGEESGIVQHFMGQLVKYNNKFINENDPENNMVRGEIYGLIEDQKVYIIPSQLNELMKPFDTGRIIAIAEKLGVLVYNKEKKKGDKKVSKRIGSFKPDCYVFDINKIEKYLGKE